MNKKKKGNGQTKLLLIVSPFIVLALVLLAIYDPADLKDILKTLIVGFASFVLGMWYFNAYILPKVYVKMGSNLFKGAENDPSFKPWIDKFKKIMEELEPFVAKLKTVDVEQIQKDVQPLIAALKKVDPKDIEDLMKTLKELGGTVKNAIEKPENIPKPT
jgi:hypothetical protein